MSDNTAAPVKGMISAFHRGTLLAKRISRNAQNTSSAQALDTLQLAQALQRSLESSERSLKDAYAVSLNAFGRHFQSAIANDAAITNRLQALTINFQDQIMGLDEYMDDPESFDLGQFRYITRESTRCCDQALLTLSLIHNAMEQERLRRVCLPEQADQTRDDRKSLSSPTQQTPFNVPGSEGNREPQSTPTATEAVSDCTLNARAFVDQASPEEDPEQSLIKSEDILRQMHINEQLLERRRQTRLSFQQDLRSLQHGSADFLENDPSLPTLACSGPDSQEVGGPQCTVSAVVVPQPRHESLQSVDTGSHEVEPKVQEDIARHHADASLGSRHLSFPFSPDSVGGRSSMATTSSTFSTASIPLDLVSLRLFESQPGASAVPLTPPHDEGHQSVKEYFGSLSRTLRLPDFGKGVEEGIQVVAVHDSGLVPVASSLISDPGLMLADESRQVIGPTPALREAGAMISHEASFHMYDGFCVGAKKMRDGENGAMKVIKKQFAGGDASAVVTMKCIKCAYEIGLETYENDKALTRSGIYNIVGGGGVRFRQRFLSKSHIYSHHKDKAIYACMFCVEEGITVNSHDATVFFSVTRLLRHIQTHVRPLRHVQGVTVIYGEHPDAVDFDLCFTDMDSKLDQLGELETKLSSRPTARAIVTHREGERGYKERDPDGNKSLAFAVGANIIGVTYPPRFNGQWCWGYHDGEKGFFPASTIQLNSPKRDYINTSPKSSLVAVARWEHKPKDPDGGWLSFKPKEKITNIDFAYEGSWCWSGMNSKGKPGIFPAAFVEGLIKVDGSGKRIDIKDVSSKAIKAISAGAEERWSSNRGSGMWTGIGAPTVDPINAPRPVRQAKKKKETVESANQTSTSLERPNLNLVTSRSDSIGGASFFSRKSFGRRATNGSHSSQGSPRTSLL